MLRPHFGSPAILFASEHGPYWDVGLITGVIYNWWMVRTKSVADCILMHAVTNAALSIVRDRKRQLAVLAIMGRLR